MINVSAAYKEAIKENRNFQVDIKIELKNQETPLYIEKKDLLGLSIEDNVSGTSSFDIGAAVINQATLKLDNTDGRYDDYNFEGAKVSVKVGLQIGEQVEWLNKGFYTSDPGEDTGAVLTLTACDSMARFDRSYKDSALQYPATLGDIVKDACSVCGVSLATVSFDMDDYVVARRPEDSALTFREILCWVGQVSCHWCRCDNEGRLELNFYDVTGYEDDSGDFHEINRLMQCNISTDDIVVTGVKVTQEIEGENGVENVEYLSGAEGYVLGIKDNGLIQGDSGQTLASLLGEKLIGLKFRKLSVSHQSDPSIEAGDIARVTDRKGNIYKTLLTGTNFQLGGSQKSECSAESPRRKSSERFSQQTQNYVKLRDQIKAEISEREKAIEDLANSLAKSSGMYITEEKQDDGSSIFYLHDKPTLAESQNVIKITAEAIGVSNDGGKTYPYGFKLTGEMITKLLYAEGIDADFIKTGALTVKDNGGKIIFQANISTGQVIISGDHVAIGNQTASEAIQDALDKAQSAEDTAINAKDMTVTLSNDYQSIPVDADGNYTVFPECETTVTVTYGSSDITSECVVTIQKSNAITGSWDNSTKTYTVTGLSSDTGWVDIKVTYLNSMVKTKRFNIAKLYAGAQGDPGVSGTDGRVYFLESNAEIIKSGGETMTPSYIRATSYYRSGSSTSKVLYAGRFRVEESYDGGDSWITIYTSAGNENEVLHSLYTFLTDDEGNALTDDAGYGLAVYRDISMVRISLYAAGGTSVLIDQQVYTVVKDVDALTHEEIFNLLTNNGQVKGIYKEGDQLYISFTYAKGGQLTLGGANNGNGVLVMLDANGNKIGRWDNAAWEMTNPASGRTVRMIDGNVYLLLNGEVCGRIGAFRWGNNVTDPEGTTYLTNKKYLGIGHYNQDGTGESDIVINNGLNPDGATERIIYRGTERHQNNNYFEKNVYIGQNGARISSFTDSTRLTIPEGLNIGGRFTCGNAELESITKIGNKTPYSGRISLGVNGNSESFLEVKDGLITGVVTEILS